MGKKLEFTVENNTKAVTFIAAAVAGISKAKADLLVKSGEVRVNGARIRSNATLLKGDTVSVFVPDGIRQSSDGIKTVYDDDNIVVFDKPKRTPYDALPQMYGAPLLAVHRLDTNTTGVIVFAKNERALGELSAAFRDRRVSKIYEAVVDPSPINDRDTVTAYTKLIQCKNYAAVSAKPQVGYKTMITEYEVIERIGRAAHLRVIPHTGRTHQIRAHLSFIGCPIIGEHKYGAKRSGERADGAPDSQMLAAVQLRFFGMGGELRYLNDKTFEVDSGFDLDFLRK